MISFIFLFILAGKELEALLRLMSMNTEASCISLKV
jgi:hypothetical protein